MISESSDLLSMHYMEIDYFFIWISLIHSTLRECVEKLQLLKTPEERQRRLCQIPEVHFDPNMDPHYESEDASEMDRKKQGSLCCLAIFMIVSVMHLISFSLLNI